MATAEGRFEEFLQRARQDAAVIGLVVTGSRGKGFHHPHSDYDVHLILAEGTDAPYESGIDAIPGIDLSVWSLEEFAAYAGWGTKERWDRYSFAHVAARIDKTGQIQPLVDAKGYVPDEVRDAFVSDQLDAYLNAFYRSVKCHMRSDSVGARLSAAASIAPFLDALFGVEGRMAPFPDRLARELEHYPLAHAPWHGSALVIALLRMLETGDLATQQEVAAATEQHFRKAGFGAVYDAWCGAIDEAIAARIA